ncbi:FHA domain-containing protein [Jeongeupia naejangsanensis]|uniref:FHA domain-containing protein n=1 Tax=Jeongeupia naejangsanensis TaxID=613195 RepID=A0ABS2BQP4_9NEIS|nr:FHA domain-containing protein [Jeongeupia naejangsanensis]MBM3117898.1 FHA domain-containing protein [Jeongeupia naejangsanensis]
MAKLLLCLDGNVIKEYRIHREVFAIGRRPQNDLQIENLAVSGEHARIVREGDDHVVEDLGSTNGTTVNGTPAARTVLRNGDEIGVGRYMLRYWCEPQAQGTYAETMVLREPAAVRLGVIKVLTGGNSGREIVLSKTVTSLGKPGVQVATVMRRPQGYYLSHVEGATRPQVNGKVIGDEPLLLAEEDLIELVGVRLAFFFRG